MSNIQRARQQAVENIDEGPRILRLPSSTRNTIQKTTLRTAGQVALLFGIGGIAIYPSIQKHLHSDTHVEQPDHITLDAEYVEEDTSNVVSKPITEPAPSAVAKRQLDNLTPKRIELYSVEIEAIIGALERESKRKMLTVPLAQNRYGTIVYFEQLLKGERHPAEEADAWEHAIPQLLTDTVFTEQHVPDFLERIGKLKTLYGEYLKRRKNVTEEE